MHVWLPPKKVTQWERDFLIYECANCGWKMNLNSDDKFVPSSDDKIHIPGTDLELTCEEAQVHRVQEE